MGIEYVDDTVGRVKGITEPLVARASRLVVLSAGAFGTPSILERSGIGSRDVLVRNNIEQLVDLPGVGEHFMGLYNRGISTQVMSYHNLLDHNMNALPFVAREGAETMDEVFWGTEEEIERMCSVVLITHCTE